MERKIEKRRVAVIGLGLAGVTALKNLLEEGFEAVGFEQNERVGGLWNHSTDVTQTTVLKSTRANISKQRSCYQDFPFPDEVPDYPSAEDIAKYIRSYADHFKVMDHCRLGVKIQRLDRSVDKSQWAIDFTEQGSGGSKEHFDRVLVTTGSFSRPLIPKVDGIEYFKGQVLNSQSFKDPQDLKGKRVVVVGLSQTAGDVCVDLCGVAEKVYVSHRSGARIISRGTGKPADHMATRRVTSIGLRMNALLPQLSATLGTAFVERKMRKTFPLIQPLWNLLPAAPITNCPPTMNDYIIDHFASGALVSLPGISRVTTEGTLEFTDGTSLPSINAIIFCTGYQADYSILAPSANPTAFATPEWDASPNSNGIAHARLYQGLFSTTYPQTLAFIGPWAGHSVASFSNTDLSSQAIAQVWKGNFTLPSEPEMESWCEANYAAQLKRIATWRVIKVNTDPKKLEEWLNDAAGNRVNEMLGWGREGWKFWWNDRKLYKLLVDGIDTPFLYRVFEGRKGIDGEERGRKKWEGARGVIFRVNGVKV